jgi:hypothetical protein
MTCDLSVRCCLKFEVLFLWGALWREDGSAICSAITQWSESRRIRNHTLLSHLWPSQPGGPGSLIYIPQEQDGPVTPPSFGFPLRRLLRLAGLRWRYSNPPPSWRTRSPYIYVISLRNRMVQSKVKVKVKVTLRPTVSQSVSDCWLKELSTDGTESNVHHYRITWLFLPCCLDWPLSSNGHCLQNHYLAMAGAYSLDSRSLVATDIYVTRYFIYEYGRMKRICTKDVWELSLGGLFRQMKKEI